MPSVVAVASLLAAAATLASAAPSQPLGRRAAYYVCYNNGFKGDCSVDPCALAWCPDYEPYTYNPVSVVVVSDPPVVVDTTTTTTPTKGYYVCASNGFRGDCSVDPCAASWCPDYKPYTYEPVSSVVVKKAAVDPTVCPAGTGYYQVCANGFKGCCRSDACGKQWCPDYEPYTYEPVPSVVVKKAAVDPTVCPAGTGYYQVCANGFKGCCKSDACGKQWCPDYKPWTYERVAVETIKETAPKDNTPVVVAAPVSSDPTVCPSGTGYYQVCASGFKGCCKKDACSLGYCPL